MRPPHPHSTLSPYTTLFRSLSLDNNVHDLIGEGFELGIHIGPLSDSSLVARPLTPYRRILAASPDYLARHGRPVSDRKSTRLNSSHMSISYAVFCLKKKNHD